MIPAVAYLRVSTEKQDLENQRQYLEKWASERGLQIVKYYRDFARSGFKDPLKRPGFKKMIRDVETGSVKANALVVAELSRIARNFADVFRILDVIEGKLGLVVISASPKEEFISKLDPTFRQFLRSIMAFVAHLEREFIRQRTKVALQRRQRKFKWLEVFEAHGVEVGQKYAAGASLRQLAREYGVDIKAIKRILTRLGLYKPRESICPRCFAAMTVISRDFDLAAKRIVTKYYCSNCGYETVAEVYV